MRFTRRRFLGTLAKRWSLIVLALFMPGLASPRPAARNALARSSSPLNAALDRETGGDTLIATELIKLDIPDIAENGAIVPVTVETTLPDVASLALFVEKNPNPLAARFEFQPDLDAYVSLRIKMNESCDVVVVAKSGRTFYSARKTVRVVVGGCG